APVARLRIVREVPVGSGRSDAGSMGGAPTLPAPRPPPPPAPAPLPPPLSRAGAYRRNASQAPSPENANDWTSSMVVTLPVASSRTAILFCTGLRDLRSLSCSASDTVASQASQCESAEKAAFVQKAIVFGLSSEAAVTRSS